MSRSPPAEAIRFSRRLDRSGASAINVRQRSQAPRRPVGDDERTEQQYRGARTRIGWRLFGVAEEGAAVKKSLNRRDKLTRGVRFGDISAGAGFARVPGQFSGFMHGEDEDFAVDVERGNACSGFEPAHAG